MPESVVDRLNGEFIALLEFLQQSNELSLQVTANEQCRKALLLAAASHFEHIVTGIVTAWIERLTPTNAHIVEFVRKNGISMKYHTWFNWDQRHGRTFGGLLGSPLKEFLRQHFAATLGADDALRDFLDIGQSRNRLVHQDFGTFTLEKTTEDIYVLYVSARRFPEFLEAALSAYP
jgi:hypothetical protein